MYIYSLSDLLFSNVLDFCLYLYKILYQTIFPKYLSACLAHASSPRI